MEALWITAGVEIPASDLTWTSVTGSGPGGQHVNKVATKVLLRFDLRGTQALSDAVRARLRSIAAHHLDGEGRILVTCHATRSRERNLEVVRAKLASMVCQALSPPKARRKTRTPRWAIKKRLTAKRRRSEAKRQRRRVEPDT